MITCSICGSSFEVPFPIDSAAAEREYDIYEGYCQSRYIKRQEFVPTDFYLISLQAIRARPGLIDFIAKAYESCWAPKQIGIAVLHGSVTFLRFRPRESLQTFSDDVVIPRPTLFFAGVPGFSQILIEVKQKLLDLQPTDAQQFSVAFDTVASRCSSFASNLHLILDENDFHAFASMQSIHEQAFQICEACCQVSLTVFIDEICYQNPLLDLPVVTGGFLKIFSPQTPQPLVEAGLITFIQATVYHDAYIIVPGQTVCDFAGRGYLVSARSIEPGKIAVGDAFFLSLTQIQRPFIQIVAFFTTELNVRKVRVVTLDVAKHPPPNTSATNVWIGALVAQRLLNEGMDSARQALSKFRAVGDDVVVFERLLNEKLIIERYRMALLVRSGAPMDERREVGGDAPVTV
jgi:hypothetical protein